MSRKSTFLVAVSLGVCTAAVAQQDFDDLTFRSIGPAVMGGRIDAVAVVADEPWTLYIGSASGGVWKSLNKGTTWTPVFDVQTTSSIGDVVVSPSDPDTVWVGTGEPNNRQSSSFGDGVYKSLDGGKSWAHLGLQGTHHIGKILLDPQRPRRVFVAAVGSLWQASEERGVYRSDDGGQTWSKVLYVDDNTGVSTIVMDPEDPDTLYAAAYQRRRTPWGFSGGGPGSGFYKTADGGESWRHITAGLPEGQLGRLGVAVFHGNPRVLYLLVEHRNEGGLYRSRDRGESWEKINDLNPRPMYYSKIFADPGDSDRIYVLGSSFHVSDDGGHTFEINREMTPTYDVGVHGDHHALWVDPKNSDHLVLGGDGGLYFSWDRGLNWDKVNNIPIAQFYAIAVDMAEPYNIYGGAQDTHSWTGPSATRNQIGILNSDWRQINFGDGMYQQADPTNPSIVYTESQGGNIVRLDRRTGDRKTIKPYPEEKQARYRFHWTSPILISRHDPTTLYLGGNRLFISSDRGDSWTATADLTRNEDRDELPIMGVIPDEDTLSRHDGVGAWGTITTISESPLSAGTLFVGTDDGRIQLTRDGGESWESVEANLKGFDPLRAKVSRVVASHASASRAYASFDRHHLGDFAPYLFATEDFGKSWRSLSTPKRAGWINVVVEHSKNADLLFAGAETGLFISTDRGASWSRMTGDLPTVPVDDVVIHPRDNDLVVGTHGRSVFILDDITPLERYREDGGDVQLFEPRRATIFLPWKHESYGAQAQFIGENPAFGALVTYHLADAIEDGVELIMSDGSGRELRTLDGPGRMGFNRVVWDLRSTGPAGVEGGRGPLVPPSRYAVRLAAGSAVLETSVEVVLDPRLEIGSGESQARFEFLSRVNALRARLQDRVSRTKELESELGKLKSFFDGEAEADKTLRGALEEFGERVSEIKGDIGGGTRSFRNPDLLARASRLFGELSGDEVRQGSLHAPTPVQERRLRSLENEADVAIAELDAVLNEGIPRIDELLEERGPLSLKN